MLGRNHRGLDHGLDSIPGLRKNCGANENRPRPYAIPVAASPIDRIPYDGVLHAVLRTDKSSNDLTCMDTYAQLTNMLTFIETLSIDLPHDALHLKSDFDGVHILGFLIENTE
jgi:hypothetical protein